MGLTVAVPCDELLIVRVVEELGSEDVVHEIKSWVEIKVDPLEKRKWVPVYVKPVMFPTPAAWVVQSPRLKEVEKKIVPLLDNAKRVLFA